MSPEETPQQHSHVCPWWLAYSFDNPLRRFFHNPEELFYPYVKPGMTVADIGCGMGYFSIGLARMVGEQGKVYSVDIQQKMLDILMKRAGCKGLHHRIRPRLATADNFHIDDKLDFVLASWMVHETDNVDRFFSQVHDILKPDGLFFMTEPKMHVKSERFEEEIDSALKSSFTLKNRPTVKFSHSVVLKKS